MAKMVKNMVAIFIEMEKKTYGRTEVCSAED
jgi:hypothetical protein